MGGGDYTPAPVTYPTVETKVVEVPTTQATKSVSEASKAATEQQKQKNQKSKGIAGSILTSKGSSSAGGMATSEDASEKSKTLG